MSKTAILIDDDHDDLEFLQEAICKIDNSVKCIPYLFCDEALDELSTNPPFLPHYIFIDVNMPRLDGQQCLIALRKNSMFDHSIITVLSTSMPPSVAKHLKENGANFTFQKPNKFDEYHHILTHILQ
jgi:CheY-like chemotaxis protein